MSHSRFVIFIVLGAAAAVLAPARTATPQVPVGGDFPLAETSTSSSLQWPLVVAQPDGGFVVSFVRSEFTFPPPDLRQHFVGRRYDARGTQQGEEFVIFPSLERITGPTIAAQPDGFVVVWNTFTASESTLWARRFDPAGTPLGAELVVDSVGSGWHLGWTVASDPGGGFLAVWTAYDGQTYAYSLRGRRFGATGQPVGAAFPISGDTPRRPSAAGASVAGDGTSVVAWGTDNDLDGNRRVFARRFSSAGTPLTDPILVTTPNPWLAALGVAGDPAGNFTVGWLDWVVMTRRFRADGTPLSSETPVMRIPPDEGTKMVAGPAGDFAVVWENWRWPFLRLDVFARRFGSDGFGPSAFRVNTSEVEYHVGPQVALHGDGRMQVVWQATPDLETSSGRPLARRVGAVGPAGLAIDPAPGASSNGNGVLDPGETVVVAPAWRNASADTQTLTGQAARFTGPAGQPYTILDGHAQYPALASGATRDCLAAGDCYQVSLAGVVRPAQHWDASFEEEVAGSLSEAVVRSVHVGGSFSDVRVGDAYERFVETLFHRGATNGCGDGLYCGDAPTTRAQAAPLALLAREPVGYAPPVRCYAGQAPFHDVPPESPYCNWILELVARGVLAGCGSGYFCADAPLARQEAAVLALRLQEPSLSPPACTAGHERFRDVPAASPFCRWVEELARRGVSTGCGGGDFCPTAAVTRGQIAVLLVQAFGLALYGP